MKLWTFFLVVATMIAACDPPSRDGARVLSTPAQDLVSVHIVPDEGDSFSIPLTSEGIPMEFPDLDVSKQGELRSALARIRLSHSFPIKSGELRQYGLEAPALRMSVKLSKDLPLELEFGAFSNYSGKRYVRIVGESQAYLVSEKFFETFNKQHAYFIDSRLLSLDEKILCAITIDAPEIKIQLEQNEAGWWQRREQVLYPADPRAVESLLGSLRLLRSQERLSVEGSENVFPYAFTFTSCSGEVQSLALTAVRSDPFAIEGEPLRIRVSKRPGALYEIKRHDAPVINIESLEFRKVTPFAFPIEEVSEAQFLNAEDPRILRRSEDSWLVNGAQADPPFVRSVLSALSELSILRYIDTAGEVEQVTRMTPFLDIRLLSMEKSTLLQGTFWKVPDKNKFFAWDEKYKALFEVSAEQIKKIYPAMEVLLSQEIFENGVSANNDELREGQNEVTLSRR